MKKETRMKKISRLSMVWMLCMTLLFGCAKEEDTGELLIPMPNETTKILAQQMEDHTYRFDMMMKHRSFASGDMEEFLIKVGSEQRDAVLVQARKEQVAAFEANFPRDYREEDYMENEVSSTYFITRGGYCYELAVYTKEGQYFMDYDVWEMKVFVSKLENDTFRLKQVFDIEPMSLDAPTTGLYLEDANFDGMLDLIVCTGYTGNQNAGIYECFLFDGEQYNLCDSYGSIFNAYVDADKQVVHSAIRGSAVSHTYYIYVFKNGEFRLERSLTIEPDETTDVAGAEEDYIWQYTEKVFNTDIPYGEKPEYTVEVHSEKDEKALIEEKYESENSIWYTGPEVLGGLDGETYSGGIAGGVTADMLLSCEKEPDVEDYFTDELVFLGEYPVSGAIKGKQYENLSLYGSRIDGESDTLILSLDHKLIYEIPWNWENVYREAPKLGFIQADGDEDTEILIQGIYQAGVEWHTDRIGLVDFADPITLTALIANHDWIRLNTEAVNIPFQDNIIEITYNGEVNTFTLSDWSNWDTCTGIKDFIPIGVNAEEGTIDARLYVDLKTHKRVYDGIIIKFAIVVKDKKFYLEALSATQEY